MKEEILRLDRISFSYGKNQIIKDFSLSVERGSFTTLLGPSGCGKTTLLRIIAGFLKPSKGTVWLNGKNVTDVPVEQRKIGFVFQDYALFPHMTVKENLLFGFGGKEKKNQIENMEEISSSLGILNLLDRFPHELSGGQQQRVALGRTLMMKPEIILMDEPLSSLDAKLRLHVRQELMEIQKKIGITTVYVTHDQEEALSLSDKIAVMNEGNLLQYDSPENVYFKPESRTAAEFTGMTNFLCKDGKEIMVRPEWFVVEKEKGAGDELEGTVISSSFLGGVTRYVIACKDAVCGSLTVDVFSGAMKKSLEEGETVFLKIITSVCFN